MEVKILDMQSKIKYIEKEIEKENMRGENYHDGKIEKLEKKAQEI